MKGRLYQASLTVLPRLYLGLARLLFGSCRVELRGEGAAHYQRLLASGAPFIVCFWHYSIAFAIQLVGGRNWVAMVSASEDAEYISRILNLMGHDTVRGSRGKGGLAAIKELMAAVQAQNKKAAIVADGSQGPALEVQAGVILLASKTGIPILPLTVSADRYWAFRSWDRTMLPKPFSRVVLCYGEPLLVPSPLKSHDLEANRQLLEERLLDLYCQAWSVFGRTGHVEGA